MHRPADDRRLVLAGDRQQGRRSDQPAVGRVALRHPGAGPAARSPTRRTTSTRRSRTSSSTGRRCRARAYYDVQVPLDADFNNITYSHQRSRARDYSPPTTLDERPVLVAGPRRRPRRPADAVDDVAERVQAPVAGPAPARCTRIGTESPGTMGRPVHPVDAGAARVALRVRRSPPTRTSRRRGKSCKAVGDDLHAGSTASGECAVTRRDRSAGRSGRSTTRTRWRRSAAASSRHPQACQVDTRAAPPRGRSTWTPAPVTGLKVALDGTGAVGGGYGCTVRRRLNDTSATACRPPRSSPGTRCPDANFVPRLRRPGRQLHDQRDRPAVSTRPTPCSRAPDDRRTSPESQAGSAYFWHVRPVLSAGGCGPRPRVARHARRHSERVPQGVAGDRWAGATRPQRERDHASAGRTTSTPTGHVAWNGASRATRPPGPTGIQVSPDPSFSLIIDDDGSWTRPPYTASDRLYADGTYYWRVQASTSSNYGLTWSPRASFTKSSPAVVPILAGGGAAGVRHDAVPLGGPAVRRVVHGRGLQEQRPVVQRREPGVPRDGEDDRVRAAVGPIPAAGTPYVWRVRRHRRVGNLGPWSGRQRSSRRARRRTCSARRRASG